MTNNEILLRAIWLAIERGDLPAVAKALDEELRVNARRMPCERCGYVSEANPCDWCTRPHVETAG